MTFFVSDVPAEMSQRSDSVTGGFVSSLCPSKKSTEIIYGPNRSQIVYLPQLLKLEVKVALPSNGS